MEITRKDAAVVAAPTTDAGPGTFEAILSAPTKDRDGDVLTSDTWKLPLPDKIPVDIDHAMDVRNTIGSAHPFLDDDGNLRISGTFASTPLAQEVRLLMAEGHIDRTSVAFMTEPAETKDGKTVQLRELLNAAVVCIPSNREAAVLAVRSLNAKAGARNSASDLEHIQAIHDHAAALGADCGAKSWHHPGVDDVSQIPQPDAAGQSEASETKSASAAPDERADADTESDADDETEIAVKTALAAIQAASTAYEEA